jgi:hypothetical protein
MHRPCTYVVVIYFPTHLPIYETYLVTKVKTNIYSVEVHPRLSNMGHRVDGPFLGAGPQWPLSGGILGSRGWG